jgi:hypothetical protein
MCLACTLLVASGLVVCHADCTPNTIRHSLLNLRCSSVPVTAHHHCSMRVAKTTHSSVNARCCSNIPKVPRRGIPPPVRDVPADGGADVKQQGVLGCVQQCKGAMLLCTLVWACLGASYCAVAGLHTRTHVQEATASDPAMHQARMLAQQPTREAPAHAATRPPRAPSAAVLVMMVYHAAAMIHIKRKTSPSTSKYIVEPSELSTYVHHVHLFTSHSTKRMIRSQYYTNVAWGSGALLEPACVS